MKTDPKSNKNNSLSITANDAGAGNFVRVFQANGKEVSPAQQLLLERYVACLREWNAKVNLVSRKDEENIWLRQILASSLFLVKYEFAPGSHVLDLGTGGGLPGIPIAILCPEVTVLLVDSIAKKIKAVEDIIGRLGLTNASAVWSRVEDLRGRDGTFDCVVARAVAPAAEIIGWCRRLLKKGRAAGDGIPTGSIVLLKGGELDAEILEVKKRYPAATLSVEPLGAAGVGPDELPDKKIVIIRL